MSTEMCPTIVLSQLVGRGAAQRYLWGSSGSMALVCSIWGLVPFLRYIAQGQMSRSSYSISPSSHSTVCYQIWPFPPALLWSKSPISPWAGQKGTKLPKQLPHYP